MEGYDVMTKNEATWDIIYTDIIREKVNDLIDAEVVFLTNDLPFAINLQRSCLKWRLDYSWHLIRNKDHPDLDYPMDIIILDCDMGVDRVYSICHDLAKKDKKLPVLLIGSANFAMSKTDAPENIRGFVLKRLGAEKVVEYTIAIANDLF